jgi:hypothetical protein
MILQTLLVFAMIGLLGLVLRWTFKRDKDAPEWPGPSTPWASPDLTGRAAHSVTMPASGPAAAAELSEPVTLDDGDDYGLLAEAARVESPEEAERIRGVLAAAGVRATTTVGRDGRTRVLVFAPDVHRARRIANGS